MKFWLACVALILAPASIVSGQELKPKFGDIGGVFYTEVSENREACQQAIRSKIALCSQNTSFESNTKDRKYPGCLPIFRDQSRGCVDHFRSEAYKCQGSGSVRIEDFTGFACTVTATVVEEGDEPERRDPESGDGNRAGRNDGTCKIARGAAERVSEANESVDGRYRLYTDAVDGNHSRAIDRTGAEFDVAMRDYKVAEDAAAPAFEGGGRGFRDAWRNYKTVADTARRKQKTRGRAAWREYVAARKATSRDRWDALRSAHRATVRAFWSDLMTARRNAMRDLKAAVAALCQ